MVEPIHGQGDGQVVGTGWQGAQLGALKANVQLGEAPIESQTRAGSRVGLERPGENVRERTSRALSNGPSCYGARVFAGD